MRHTGNNTSPSVVGLSASEVIRSALRLMQHEEQKKRTLNKTLVVGEKSGFAKTFDAKANLKKLHRKFV